MEKPDEIQNSQYDLTAKVFQNKLKQAQQALDTNNFEAAKNFFKQALMVPGPRSKREFNICQILKQYSSQAAEQTPPRWDLAGQTLDLLARLKIQNDQMRAWQRDLGLKEAQFRLAQEDVTEASKVFAKLVDEAEQPEIEEKLKANILAIARGYILQHTGQRRWSSPGQVVDHLKTLWPPPDSTPDWLDTVSQILSTAGQAQTEYNQRLATLEKELAARNQTTQTIDQGQQRYRTLTYALTAILISAVVVVFMVILILLFIG